jgi:hypothetical protein
MTLQNVSVLADPNGDTVKASTSFSLSNIGTFSSNPTKGMELYKHSFRFGRDLVIGRSKKFYQLSVESIISEVNSELEQARGSVSQRLKCC